MVSERYRDWVDHLKFEPVALAARLRTVEATAGVVSTQPVRAHARVLVLADAAADKAARDTLIHGPQFVARE